MPITSTWTDITDYVLDYFWGFAEANVLKSNVQYLYERFAGDMEADASVGVGGLGVSSDVNYSLTSSLVDVTGMTCSITTSGRPVLCSVIQQAASAQDAIISFSTGLSVSDRIGRAYFRLVRGSTTVGDLYIQSTFATVPDPAGSNSISLQIPATSLQWIDFPTAGTYTYKVQGTYDSGATSGGITGRLAVVEL